MARSLIICGAVGIGLLCTDGSSAAVSDAYTVVLPSGITAEFVDVVTADITDGLTYSFRFVASDLPKSAEAYENLESDMMYLCENFAIQRLADPGPKPKHVVISIADHVGDYGSYNAEITTFFDSFDVSRNMCEWEYY